MESLKDSITLRMVSQSHVMLNTKLAHHHRPDRRPTLDALVRRQAARDTVAGHPAGDKSLHTRGGSNAFQRKGFRPARRPVDCGVNKLLPLGSD
jgi:hypothetical protein